MAGSSAQGNANESIDSFYESHMDSQWAGIDTTLGGFPSRPLGRGISGPQVHGPRSHMRASDLPPPPFPAMNYGMGPRYSYPPPYAQGVYSGGPSYPFASQYAQSLHTSGPSFPFHYGGAFSHMLHGEDPPPEFMASSSSANSMTSTPVENRYQKDSSSSRKSSRRSDDEVVVSSPCKKTKSKGKKAEKNKMWLPEHDLSLIPFLADQARSGNKADKMFKATALNMAANHINTVFGTDYTGAHVKNRIKGLKRRLADVEVCRHISGAGWDEEEQKITLDEEVYRPWAKVVYRLFEKSNLFFFTH